MRGVRRVVWKLGAQRCRQEVLATGRTGHGEKTGCSASPCISALSGGSGLGNREDYVAAS